MLSLIIHKLLPQLQASLDGPSVLRRVQNTIENAQAIEEYFYVLEHSAEGALLAANSPYLSRVGYSLCELQDQSHSALSARSSDAGYLARMWECVQSGQSWCGEFCDVASDGSFVWINAIVYPCVDDEGALTSIVTIGVDVTERRAAEEALKHANARLGAFIKHAPAAVAMFDRDMRYVAHTDRWLTEYNLPSASLVGRSHYDVFPECPDHWKRKHQRILAGATEFSEEEKFARADGSENVIRWEVRPWYLADKSIGGMMMMTEEITERNKLHDRLWRLAKLDSLTSLPNRLSFNEFLQNQIQFASSVNGRFAVALFDVDWFKEINDTLGHDVGDKALAEIAQRLDRALKGFGTIARLGGDEFAALLPGSGEEIAKAVSSMENAMREPIVFGTIRRVLTASIGVTMFPSDGTEGSELLKNADLALYRAKSEGRSRSVSFIPEMRTVLKRKVELRQQAFDGLADNQFVMYFQPIIPANGARPPSYEALLRWQHPKYGLLAPNAFEDLFEEPGIAAALGERVLDMSVAQAAAWIEEQFVFDRVAVNVSMADFSAGCFAKRLETALNRHGISGDRISIEVTERVFLGAGSAHVAHALAKVREFGVEVALDDFGTGYASLIHLKTFPLDRLKIDRSFVQDLHESEDSLSIVRATIQLARNLGFQVTAEGVERDEQLSILQNLGCGSFQGYLFARAAPADALSSPATGH